ncbi:MAG: asparagine synthase (glutamine-hydrolyzing) [bacterium]|nr:asparagine synthase (glutamine-hydrolyzing) [bacterium]
MCGIAGIWHLNKNELSFEKLKRFTDSLYHRGPDGEGYFIDDKAQLGLGHRRLSILDLSDAGKQPMSFADDRYQITYNGEIYNFIELQTELAAKGYTFKTETDTEVLLSAYHCWGKDCLLKFNGMWALAIWDNKEKTLFLARDRFGVKPLHFLHTATIFAFASETIAFKHLEDYERKIDGQMLVRNILDYRRMETGGYTLFEGIQQLQAGCSITLSSSGRIKEERWWKTLDQVTLYKNSYENAVEEFKDIFEDACKIRLRSDVPIASALSGGVDSSAVYCMIKHLMEKKENTKRVPSNWQKAFVATFPGAPEDERKYAEEVIAFTKGQVNYIEPNYKNLPQDIIQSTIQFDAITGTALIAVRDVYKAMRENGIVVSMDGHGADETMFGYRASVAETFFDAVLSGDKLREDDILETYINMVEEENRSSAGKRLHERAKQILVFEKGGLTKKSLNKLKLEVKSILHPNHISYLQKIKTDDWFNETELDIPSVLFDKYPDFKKYSRSDSQLLTDFHIEHIPYNMRDFDRASMQNGIEIRMPFMDHRLVTFLFGLKTEYKVGHGYTKRILRDSMKGIMPENIRNRRLKLGLSAPITTWFNGQLNEFVLDQISSQSFIQSKYWNGPLVKKFAENRTNNKTWNNEEAEKFWKILNAHIIIRNDKSAGI